MRSPFSRLDHRPTNFRVHFRTKLTFAPRTGISKMTEIKPNGGDVSLKEHTLAHTPGVVRYRSQQPLLCFLESLEWSAWMKSVPLPSLPSLPFSLPPLFRRSFGARKEDCNQSWRNKHLSPRDDKKSRRARTQGVSCHLSQSVAGSGCLLH